MIAETNDTGWTVVVTTANRMLKKFASVVLASFRPSTGTRPPH
jgi:hypothetical protein